LWLQHAQYYICPYGIESRNFKPRAGRTCTVPPHIETRHTHHSDYHAMLGQAVMRRRDKLPADVLGSNEYTALNLLRVVA